MWELIPIVNNKDQIICYKEQSEVKPWDIKRISCLLIENLKWDVLLAKRSYTMERRPWKWWSAAGWCVDKGESYEEAMKREAKEELWIEIKNYKKTSKVRYKMIFIQHFKAIMDLEIEKLKLQKEEVDSVKWISKDELYKQCKENPDDFVPQLLEFIDEYVK